MIHISNAKLYEALNSTVDKFTNLATDDEFPKFGESEFSSTVFALAVLMSNLGLKSKDEGLDALIQRLSEPDEAHSIFVEEHRKIVGVMIQEMFAPTGAKRFVMIGVTEYNKCIVIPVQSTSNKIMEMDEVVVAFQHCIDAYKNGENDTIEI